VLNDLLNYDKIEMGTLRMDYATVNVFPLLRKVVAVMQVQAEQKDVRLEMTDPEEMLVEVVPTADSAAVVGDAMRLEQVVRSLISNALKFTPSDGIVTVAGMVYYCFIIVSTTSFDQRIFYFIYFLNVLCVRSVENIER
jgi:signal transduction histidine kinase